tara:strand:- start:1891 stop:2874 length:984 start_codon:yes stop_codon:yes gene_type:complete
MIKTNELQGKNILYIGLNYFSYPEKITEQLKSFGAKVDFFPIYENGNKIKIIRRLSSKLEKIQTKKYFSKLLINNKDYDYVFFITVHWVPLEIMEEIKNKFSNSKFILYNWDSVITHDVIPYVKYFHKVFSFDPIDCEKYNFNYLPLFFSKDYENIRQHDLRKNKLTFIGRFNNIRRYHFVKKVDKICQNINLDFFHYLFIHPTTFIKICLENKKLLNLKYFKFNSLSSKEISKIFKESTCIIDLPNNFQSGLTMRVIESLGSHKKLITTNHNIKNEEFYNPKIINILNPSDMKIDLDFINSRASSKDFEKIENYSLKNWIINIFRN